MSTSHSDVIGGYVVALVATAVVGSLVGWWLVIVVASVVAGGALLTAAMPTIQLAWSKRQYRRAKQREADEAQRREAEYQQWASRQAQRVADRRAAPKPSIPTPTQLPPVQDVSASPVEHQPAVWSPGQRRAIAMITETMRASGNRYAKTSDVTARFGISGKQLATALRGTGIAPCQLGSYVLEHNPRGYTADVIEAATGEAIGAEVRQQTQVDG